jgi:predicted regulator of Ras-like GTPase activity (Roadblock/LC7/MglB family)
VTRFWWQIRHRVKHWKTLEAHCWLCYIAFRPRDVNRLAGSAKVEPKQALCFLRLNRKFNFRSDRPPFVLAFLINHEKVVSMADTPILLRERQYHQIKAVLARLRMDSSARVVFLVDKDGQEIAVQGEIGNLDTTSLASLAAGNVAATGGMAQLIGEKEFPTLSHEGERESIHISVIGRLLLVVVFDERSTLGLVKLRSKQISQQLAALIDEITQAEFEDEDSPFAEITDEDIDSLFK